MKRLLVAFAAVAALLVVVSKAIPARAHDQQMQNANAAVWFEIPVVDMDRAIAFYNAVMATTITKDESMGIPMGFFPASKNYGAAGALIKMDVMKPGVDGPLVYLNGGPDLQVVLDRVVPAGGQIAVPKTKISDEIGYFAVFIDTEGNRLGLFSSK